MQKSIIFIDLEGYPLQEMSALEMSGTTFNPIDVFHEHAYSEDIELDWYARKHIHGLSPAYLKANGHATPSKLIDSFKTWLSKKKYKLLYANDPTMERITLGLELEIQDIKLERWANRINKPYHQIAQDFKVSFDSICCKRCSPLAHSSFQGAIIKRPNNPSDLARHAHGFHCSLYDVYELYLFYCLEM